MESNEIKESNSDNLLYFESDSMKDLYGIMKEWQSEHKKRLLSCSILKDKNKYCCISLTNPTEVIICDGEGRGYKAEVSSTGAIRVY